MGHGCLNGHTSSWEREREKDEDKKTESALRAEKKTSIKCSNSATRPSIVFNWQTTKSWPLLLPTSPCGKGQGENGASNNLSK